MSSWRTPNASDPDGTDEWRFRPLSETDALTATALISQFAPRWLRAAGLPESRVADVPDTIELMVAEQWDPPDGGLILRLRSWYTGETAWLPDWDGSIAGASDWMDDQADLRGAWVHDERDLSGEGTVWDE